MQNLIFYIFSAIFGLIVGSFLNALIWRLRAGKSILLGRSICPKCKHKLAWTDLFPIFSYVFLKCKCRYCHKTISPIYPLVELATAIIFVLVFYNFYQGADSLFLIFSNWLFVCVLIIIFVYDLRWGEILDKVSLPSMVVILSLNLLLGVSWKSLFIAAFVGGAFFLFQYLISRGKWLGAGDIRMGALMGFMLGWPNILVGLFLAYVVGALFAIPLIAAGRKKLNSTIALGTFLSIGTVIALIWGGEIISWYLNL